MGQPLDIWGEKIGTNDLFTENVDDFPRPTSYHVWFWNEMMYNFWKVWMNNKNICETWKIFVEKWVDYFGFVYVPPPTAV